MDHVNTIINDDNKTLLIPNQFLKKIKERGILTTTLINSITR